MASAAVGAAPSTADGAASACDGGAAEGVRLSTEGMAVREIRPSMERRRGSVGEVDWGGSRSSIGLSLAWPSGETTLGAAPPGTGDFRPSAPSDAAAAADGEEEEEEEEMEEEGLGFRV